MNKQKELSYKRKRRHFRVRKDVAGTAGRPRVSVFRSHNNLYCQVIDDAAGRTLLAISTQTKDIRPSVGYGGNVKAARALGEALAKAAAEKGITKVCFDKGGYMYHGRVKAFADAARKAGLKF